MYRIWFWVLIDRESNDWFVASIPDLSDLAWFGGTGKRAVAQVAELRGKL